MADIGRPLKRHKVVPLTEPVPGKEPTQPAVPTRRETTPQEEPALVPER